MKRVIELRWVFVALWIAAAIALVVTSPDMARLVSEKGQISIPDGYDFTYAEQLLAEKSGKDKPTNSTVIAFYSESGFDEQSELAVQQALEALKANQALGITEVTTHFDTPELEEQMVAEDRKTIITLMSVDFLDRDKATAKKDLTEAVDQLGLEAYVTGNWIIQEDLVQSSQDGLKKTELITVGFILIILFIVFKSLAAPFVPLLTVGISYLISQSIVAYLVEYFDFPLSTFTQIFLVAILFGIGTDYCILLISRYKEELGKLNDKKTAIVATYRTAGKTIFVSGLAVLVGFISIGLSKFILFQSAVAVAIGIVVMLVAIYTLIPFFLYILGKGMFWPSKGNLEHGQSKLWDRVGHFSLTKPMRALLILAVIIVPLLLANKGTISYNSLDEVGEKYDSVKGFNLIANSFGPGEALPTTVVIKADQPFDTPEGLSIIELTTRELLKVDGVEKVRSATRPVGDVLEDFLVADQVQILEEGLDEGNEGLTQIREGLEDASHALAENAPQLAEAENGAKQLVDGTNQLQAGISQLSSGLSQIAEGMKDGSMGAQELRAGLEQLQQNAEQLAGVGEQLSSGYQEIEAGLAQLQGGYINVQTQLSSFASNLEGVQGGLTSLATSYPELAADATYQALVATMSELTKGASILSATIEQLNGGLTEITIGLTEANQGLQQATQGQIAFAQAMPDVVEGIKQLQAGLDQLYDGQTEAVNQLPSVNSGLISLADGQLQLQQGFAQLQAQLAELTNGLNQGADGLRQVTDGIDTAGVYLQGLIKSPDKQLSGWHIPQEAIEDESFQTVLNTYMSEDRTITTLDVILSVNPYTKEAIDTIEPIKENVLATLEGTDFETEVVHIGGVTSMNHDLQQLSDEDYSRTMLIMLIGIFIILLVLFRSIVMPVYIVVSLLITYFTSLSITELIFVNAVGVEGVSWAVPFFGFVLLIALGVDYSIFLMDRFKENNHLEPKQAIHEAMKSMGSVIISAAVILGGTFAAMLPSGMMSLLQIATLVLSGLFLYALFMLPLFIPVMVRLFGKYNWWPFMPKGRGD